MAARERIALAGVALAVLVLGSAVVLATFGVRSRAGGRGPSAGPAALAGSSSGSAGLANLPLAAQGPISAVLGRDLGGYSVTDLETINRVQRLRAEFSRGGARIDSAGVRFGLRAVAVGYGVRLRTLPSAAPVVRANRVSYSLGGLDAWWANGPLGLEQGFTLPSRPGDGTGWLTLSLALSGGVTPRLAGGSVVLRGRGGSLRYDDLVASDARGRTLPARFALCPGRILIEVDDRDASYPVRIDPLVQQSQLSASDGVDGDGFGGVVAVAGNTIVVGAPDHAVVFDGYHRTGAAYVFVEPAGGWSATSTENAELTANNPLSTTFGGTVATNGTTVVVGAYSTELTTNGSNYGAAYVFEEPAGGWSGALTPSSELTASDGQAHDTFGWSVAMSGDTIVVGDPNHTVNGNFQQGALYVFSQPAGSGTPTQVGELTVDGGVGGDLLGDAIAVSGDTVVAGVEPRNVAYVFEAPPGGWAGMQTQSAELTASNLDDLGTNDGFGTTVAVSGGTVAVGTPAEDVGSGYAGGAVYVFEEPAAGWAGSLTQGAELAVGPFATSSALGGALGITLAMSGNTIVAGGVDSSGTGSGVPAVYVFTEPSDGWSGLVGPSGEVTGSAETGGSDFGETGGGVAIAQGSLVVGDGWPLNKGTAYVFGCGGSASSAADDRGRSDSVRASAAATAPGLCSLTVDAVAFDPTQPTANVSYLPVAGLHYDTASGTVGFLSDSSSPQFASIDGTGLEFPQACLSGCTNIGVLVTNPNQGGAAVPGATVTANVAPLEFQAIDTSATSPFAVEPPAAAPGYVCALGGSCGTSVTATTDASGIALFRYWLPGLIDEGGTYPQPIEVMTFSAQGSACSSFGCLLGATGSDDFGLHLYPRLWVNKTEVVTAQETAGLEDLISTNALNKQNAQTDVKNILQVLKAAKIFTKEGLEQLKGVADIAQDEAVDQLLRRDKDSVMTDWFMGKFGITSDGLLDGNFDARAWGQELKPLLVNFLTSKVTSAKVLKRFESKIHDKLDQFAQAIIKDSFEQQVVKIVTELAARAKLKPHNNGRATLKLFDVSYCGGSQCTALPLPQEYDGLFMLFSEVNAHKANYFFPTPLNSEPAINFTAQRWLRAQCGAGYGCDIANQ